MHILHAYNCFLLLLFFKLDFLAKHLWKRFVDFTKF